jgi:hypothetical protein
MWDWVTALRSLIAATIIVTLTFSAGCARANAPESAAAPQPAERGQPPRMVQPGAMPELRIYGIPASGRAPIRLRIEVLIDSRGRPDMKTLKVTGQGAPENRAAIERWIEQAMFQPAQRGGRPVAGLYRTAVEVRIETRPR